MLKLWRSKTYRPGTIGRSLAFGMVVGFSPTVGLQMVICLILTLLWNRFVSSHINLAAALVGSMVVNPLTMAPTYLAYYKIGCTVVTCTVELNMEAFASIGSFFDLGLTVLVSLWIGGILFMIASIPVGLYLGRKLEGFLEHRRQRRRARRTSHLATAND